MMEKELWPGWETVKKLGNGGFGSVYCIQKTDISGTVLSALKVISIPNSPEDYDSYVDNGYDEESITAMFRNQLDDIVKEFRLMSELKGISNIVSYEDHRIVEHEDGLGWDIYIKMELLSPLPQYFREHPMGEAEVIGLGRDLCAALELCEQKKIIHRDIKPQNIFVNDYGNFKLGDFGIARTMEHTAAATKTGTYAYMAPEVYTGKPYNAVVDIYSLGLVLFWLLNERRLPFEPLGSTIPTTAMKDEAQSRRLNGEPLPETKTGSAAINAVIRKACAANPADRYQTAAELRQALERLEQPMPETEKPAEAPQPVFPPAPEARAESEPPQEEPKKWEYTATVSDTAWIPRQKPGNDGEEKHRYFCKKCGTPISANAYYCARCEQEERQTIRYRCKKCGMPVFQKDSYCTKCRQEEIPPKKEYRCKKCGKLLAGPGGAYCPKCQAEEAQLGSTMTDHCVCCGQAAATGNRLCSSCNDALYKLGLPNPITVSRLGRSYSFSWKDLKYQYDPQTKEIRDVWAVIDNVKYSVLPGTSGNMGLRECPVCRGRKTQTMLFNRGGFKTCYFDVPCGLCSGSGQISSIHPQYAQLKQKLDLQLRQAAASGKIKSDCPVCHGQGIALLLQGHPKPLGGIDYKLISAPCTMCHFGKKYQKIPKPAAYDKWVKSTGK